MAVSSSFISSALFFNKYQEIAVSNTACLRYCTSRDANFGYLHFLILLVLSPDFPLHEGHGIETASEVNDPIDLVLLRETEEKEALKTLFCTFLVLLSLYF